MDHTFTLVKFCTTPLERQIRKFIVTRQTKERGGNITNVKQEVNRCWIPQIDSKGRPISMKEKVKGEEGN